MSPDPIKDAAQELAAGAEPPGPQQEATLSSQLGPHMDAQDAGAADDAA